MTTQEPLTDLQYIPRYQGEPLYPGGYPMHPQNIPFETNNGTTTLSVMDRVEVYYSSCLNEKGELVANPPLSDDDFQVLRQWVIYMLHAPVWTRHAPEGFEQLKAHALKVKTLAELEQVVAMATDFGLQLL